MSDATRELVTIIGLLVEPILGYFLADRKRKRYVADARDRRKVPAEVVVVINDETKKAMRAGFAEAANQHMGGLRRGQQDIMSAVGNIEVRIGNALSEWRTEQAKTREERAALTDTLRKLHWAVEAQGRVSDDLKSLTGELMRMLK